MNARTHTSLLGMAAPVLYAASVVLGGALWPEYSHLRDPISLLASTGVPNALLMNVLFACYDVLLCLFGLAWWFGERHRPGSLAAMLLAVIGFLGIAMFFFRQDAPGLNMTAAGLVHIVLAGAMSLLTMLAIFLRGRAEWRELGQRKAAVYSFVSLAVVFITGGPAAFSIARHWTFGGLLERLTIGAFLLWVFVEAWLSARRPKLAG